MKRPALIISVLLILIASCKKEPPVPPDDNEITPKQARDVLYTIMNANYYWYDLMPSVNKEDYDGPEKLMAAMRYKPLDHWSFVADYDKFNAQMEGEFVGHGIMIGIDDSSRARIALIYKEAPLYKEGVRRGWIVKSVNGTDVAPLIISGNTSEYNRVMGESKAGVTNTFVFRLPDGNEKTITSTKSSFILNSVLYFDTLQLKSGLAGHIVFDSFIATSVDSLTKAFKFFNEQGINDLILDLRYNPGGFLLGAVALASFIAGNSVTANDLFIKLEFNKKKTNENISYTFKNTPYPLNINHLVVITTSATASASEVVINGLEPYMNVITIGDTTTGKCVGMGGWEYGKKYVFYPVTFKVVNKNNDSDYFDGLPPDIRVSDDITHDFSDRNELCLKEAINYLETGSLGRKGIRPFTRQPHFSERPSWMSNSFLDPEAAK
ncbi:MAG: hypothetical protein GT598_13120 [Bacteroidales bacterium]|nr:hypothetical protein [Bacteroidales bacterium]HPM17417.1 S41 family peptidase [Bacteroidales bacterium]HQG77009.1 S41 family peptidase [Bacteroidales bacterium]